MLASKPILPRYGNRTSDDHIIYRVLVFCTKYSLYPSIKAGGYGTAGWAINGDIIVDLGRLMGIDIEPPRPGGSFTSLRDMPFFGAKGKSKAGAPVADPSGQTPGKRKREDDDILRSYDSASEAVATFLRGPPLPDDTSLPSPLARRRLDEGVRVSPSTGGSSSGIPDMGDVGVFALSPRSTAATTPSPPRDAHSHLTERGSMRADPFGYLDDGGRHSITSSLPLTSVSSGVGHHSVDPYLTAPSTELSIPLVPLSEAEPLHPHAYVTFGAGMKQKEVDIFTAKHPMEAKSGNTRFPYHVPL